MKAVHAVSPDTVDAHPRVSTQQVHRRFQVSGSLSHRTPPFPPVSASLTLGLQTYATMPRFLNGESGSQSLVLSSPQRACACFLPFPEPALKKLTSLNHFSFCLSFGLSGVSFSSSPLSWTLHTAGLRWYPHDSIRYS